MKDVFLEQLDILPDFDLQCGISDVSRPQRKYCWNAKENKAFIYHCLWRYKFKYGSFIGSRGVGCRLIHIEAGVRDFDLAVPEEITRIKIDSMSDYLLAPSDFSKMCLKYEQVKGRVDVTGNLIVDVCKKLSKVATKPLAWISRSFCTIDNAQARECGRPSQTKVA